MVTKSLDYFIIGSFTIIIGTLLLMGVFFLGWLVYHDPILLVVGVPFVVVSWGLGRVLYPYVKGDD